MFFTKKVQYTLRAFVLALLAISLILGILSAKTSHGTYIFEVGTSANSDYVQANQDLTSGVITYVFKERSPILPLLWGTQAELKWSLAVLIIAFVGSLAQVVKQFGRYKISNNFVNALFLLIAMIFGIGIGSSSWLFIPLCFALVLEIVILIHAILVAFYHKQPLVSELDLVKSNVVKHATKEVK